MNTYTYYKDKHKKINASIVFVAIEGSQKECNEGMIMIYAPIGQHGEASIDYVRKCKQITKEEYLKATEGIYTPKEYIN